MFDGFPDCPARTLIFLPVVGYSLLVTPILTHHRVGKTKRVLLRFRGWHQEKHPFLNLWLRLYVPVSHVWPVPVKEKAMQHTLPHLTDTAVPQTVVPIFYVHEGEHPFCHNASCLCHANDAGMRHLLQGILDGELKLRKAYNGLIVGREVK